jgi:hypothetical protein
MDDARARDMLLRGMLGAIREGHDSEWCKKNMVKRLRRFLAPPKSAKDVLQLGPEVEAARAEFEASVARFCRRCPMPDCKGRKTEREAR